MTAHYCSFVLRLALIVGGGLLVLRPLHDIEVVAVRILEHEVAAPRIDVYLGLKFHAFGFKGGVVRVDVVGGQDEDALSAHTGQLLRRGGKVEDDFKPVLRRWRNRQPAVAGHAGGVIGHNFEAQFVAIEFQGFVLIFDPD
jgi:hypothetical protein